VKHWKTSPGSKMKLKELSASPCFADSLLSEVANYRLFFFFLLSDIFNDKKDEDLKVALLLAE